MSMQVLSVPVLASYPFIGMLSGFSLSLLLNCASVTKNCLSVSTTIWRNFYFWLKETFLNWSIQLITVLFSFLILYLICFMIFYSLAMIFWGSRFLCFSYFQFLVLSFVINLDSSTLSCAMLITFLSNWVQKITGLN